MLREAGLHRSIPQRPHSPAPIHEGIPPLDQGLEDSIGGVFRTLVAAIDRDIRMDWRLVRGAEPGNRIRLAGHATLIYPFGIPIDANRLRRVHTDLETAGDFPPCPFPVPPPIRGGIENDGDTVFDQQAGDRHQVERVAIGFVVMVG